MRRFETFTGKKRWFEIDGVNVRSSEGDAIVDDADEWIAARRKEGFAEIKRVAPAPVESGSDHRSVVIDWEENQRHIVCEIVQNYNVVTSVEFFRDDADSKEDRHNRTTYNSVAEACVAYDQLVDEICHRRATVRERAAQRVVDREKAKQPIDPGLEAQCRANPDDAEVWSVLADRLIEQGHPAGELARSKRADDEVIELLPESDELAIEWRWRHGFIHYLLVHRKTASDEDTHCMHELVRDILDLPQFRFVDSIFLGVEHTIDNDYSDTLAAIVDSPIAGGLLSLECNPWGTHFIVGNADCYEHDRDHRECIGYGDFSPYLSKLPALEYLEIGSGGAGGTLGRAPLALKTLLRRSFGLRREELQEILAIDMPLDSLTLATGARQYGADIEMADVAPILHRNLTHFGCVECEFTDELVAALVESPLLPKLRTLDLSMGRLSNARFLMRHANRFAHLEMFDVSWNLMTDADAEELTRVLPNAEVESQRTGDSVMCFAGEE